MSEKNILYIEDNRDTASAVKIILEGAGCNVELAYTGKTGLKIAKNGFDLFLLDIMLPDMSGWEIIENILKKNGVNVEKLFFIDCVSSSGAEDDVVQISPTRLSDIKCAVEAFVNEIKGKKFLVIDALSVLLIYNNENQVASFVRNITRDASDKDVEFIAFSPKTKGEELLNKIFNFFDEVKGVKGK